MKFYIKPKTKIILLITAIVLVVVGVGLIWMSNNKSADKNNEKQTAEVINITNTTAEKIQETATSESTPPVNEAKTEEPKYTLVWQDEFDQQESRWQMADWNFSESEAEFSPQMIEFGGSILKLRLMEKTDDRGSNPDKPYWGAEYYTPSEYSYGKYAVRMKPNSQPGAVTSFFLFHQDVDTAGAPTDWREIDIEFVGSNNKIQYNARWMEEGKSGLLDDEKLVDLGFDASADFHEYAIEWTTDAINFYVDDQLSYQYTDPKILTEISQPMSVRMNYWISNSPTWAGAFDKNVLPQETEYDSTAYYKLNE